MSRICLLCRENETEDSNKVCDLCCENASDHLERSAELFGAAQDMLDALEIAANRIKATLMHETPGSGEFQDLDWVLQTIHTTIAKAKGRD